MFNLVTFKSPYMDYMIIDVILEKKNILSIKIHLNSTHKYELFHKSKNTTKARQTSSINYY